MGVKCFFRFGVGVMLVGGVGMLGLVGCGGGGDEFSLDVAPLDQRALYDGECAYFDFTYADGQTYSDLNMLFKNLPAQANVENPREPIGRTDLWEFNNAGTWQEASTACFWRSSNTGGISITIVAQPIPLDTKFDNPSDESYFIQALDDFASVGERYVQPFVPSAFQLANEVVKLGASNHGEDGFAIRWNYLAFHIHVNDNSDDVIDLNRNPEEIRQRRLRTEGAAELALAEYLLKRLETFLQLFD